jgi:hypothetical protein
MPDEWEKRDPKMYNRHVKEMNDAANEVCKAYDGLVRAGRLRLAR